ncbi:hypothetical protein MOSE0_J04390 [Monosporozyma servazzii]
MMDFLLFNMILFSRLTKTCRWIVLPYLLTVNRLVSPSIGIMFVSLLLLFAYLLSCF